MIPEYKLYHGAVLAELVHQSSVPIQIDELHETGRLTSYILDSLIGLQIKHSTQRLHPWGYTFTRNNISELVELRETFPNVYVVLVCHTDGMVCLPLQDFIEILGSGDSDQAWVRVDRRRGKWYEVNGAKDQKPRKYPRGLDPILTALGGAFSTHEDEAIMEPQT